MFNNPTFDTSQLIRIKNIAQDMQKQSKNIEVLFNNDMNSCTILIKSSQQPINKFDFYPNHFGEIESVAVYGIGLKKMMETINSTKLFLGLAIDSCTLEYGIEEYLNIVINS